MSTGMTLPAIRPDQQVSRFTSDQVDLIKRTIFDEKAGCFVWTGAKNHLGYGRLNDRYVHRIIVNAPRGSVVRHSCDNPACINPDHLTIGTQAENIADAVARGRIARGAKLPQTKINMEIADEIRAAYAAGDISQQTLANKYGIHQVNVSAIIRGKAWAKK